MTTRKFQRKIEDFVCKNCGFSVKGNGYTNHCPKCLWSRHVDDNPGDRENQCKGMMKPVGAFLKNGKWGLAHKCIKCGKEKTVFLSQIDSMEKLAEVVKRKTGG